MVRPELPVPIALHGIVGPDNPLMIQPANTQKEVDTAPLPPKSILQAGTFGEAPELLMDAAVLPALVGQRIRAQLTAGGTGRSHFDNVRVERLFRVTNTADSSPGSLRQAVLEIGGAEADSVRNGPPGGENCFPSIRWKVMNGGKKAAA